VGREISTGQGTVAMLCAHMICHIGLSTYRLNSLKIRQGDEHPTYTPVRCIALYYFNFILSEAIH